jgi:hypothetical protein
MTETVLSATDLTRIRDEIGDQPGSGLLRTWYLELGHWLPVAIRALRRRRAAAVSGGDVSQVTVPGAIGVTLAKVDVTALDTQIDRLERLWAIEQGTDTGRATFGRLVRRTPR